LFFLSAKWGRIFFAWISLALGPSVLVDAPLSVSRFFPFLLINPGVQLFPIRPTVVARTTPPLSMFLPLIQSKHFYPWSGSCPIRRCPLTDFFCCALLWALRDHPRASTGSCPGFALQPFIFPVFVASSVVGQVVVFPPPPFFPMTILQACHTPFFVSVGMSCQPWVRPICLYRLCTPFLLGKGFLSF